MAVQNKFIEMLKNRPKQSNKTAQTIIPGIKKRGDCASGCLILKNCQNLNKRLIALVFQYRELMNKINIFSNSDANVRSRRNDGYEYMQGYDQCNEDIKRVCGKLLTREEENTIDVQALMKESYALMKIVEREHRGSTASIMAKTLRMRYDAFFSKLKGDVNNE